MIEIIKTCGNWEAFINGSLYHYSNDLESLLNYLTKRAEDIEEVYNE